MKTQFFLPLMTYPDQTSEVIISNAVDLAKNCGAMLHALAVDITIPEITDPWASLLIDTAKMVRDAEHASSRHGKRLVQVLERQCAQAGVSVKCETLAVSQPDAADVVAEVARHYDLALLHSASQFEALGQAVIFSSGRPAVLFPDKAFAGRIDHVAIAWDGSRAAARAFGDAAAFIGAASQVSIIYALDEKPLKADPGRRLFDSLEARGVKADAYPVHIHDRPIGDVLQEKAIELRADLLVMGGFGHSRMREFILGGATADVLGNPSLPVLMSH